MNVDYDDFYMGLVFIAAEGGESDRCCLFLLADGSMVLSHGDFMAASKHEIDPISHLAFGQGIPATAEAAFFNYTPCEKSVMSLVYSGIKRIVFFPNNNDESARISAMPGCVADITAYVGNLNWLRDRIFFLRSNEIL
jgi:hypothetical protein